MVVELRLAWQRGRDRSFLDLIWNVDRVALFSSFLGDFSTSKSGTANKVPSHTPTGILCVPLPLVSGSPEWEVRLQAAGCFSTVSRTLNLMGHGD